MSSSEDFNSVIKNRKNRVNWCRGKLAMSVELYWKRVIFSDETQVVVGNGRRVHVWRKADKMHIIKTNKPTKFSSP